MNRYVCTADITGHYEICTEDKEMKILLTAPVPEKAIEKFRKEFELTVPEKAMTYDEVSAVIDQYDGLFVIVNKADKALLDKGTKLKVVANFGVGYDNIDWKYATEKGIAVVNTPTQVTDATAEHTAVLIFDTMRSIARYDREVRSGKWESPLFPEKTQAITGSTLGILGFGRIGKMVCQKAQGMGMNVIYYDKFRATPEQEKEYNVTYMDFDDVLKNADCVTLHMPYIPENHHIINMEALKKMKKSAFLVNAARGPIVNEVELCEALKTGVIKGAGLDVYENEPHPYEGLLSLENVVLTPHAASGTMKARLGMADEAMSGITGVLKGEKPYNVVNKEVLK